MSERYDAALVQYERMRSLVTDYTEKCTDLYGSTAGGMGNYLKKLVMGWDAYSASPIHMEYFNEMKDASGSLAEGLKALSEESGEEAAELAARAVKLLLTPAEEELKYMEFAFMADDQHADGLIPFLSDEGLEETFRWIESDKLRMDGVPSQHNTLGLIKKEMAARGLEVPETGFLARLKAKFAKNK